MLHLILQLTDKIFIHHHDEKIVDIFTIGNPKITSGDLREFLKDDPTSLIIHADDKNLEKINDYLTDTKADLIQHRNWQQPFSVIEIVKQGVNKAMGIKKVADYYQIPQERIIAFGDESNDLEMIEYAKYGIAMGNAIDEVKEIAYDVTDTNEEDGIARYLEKMLFV